MVPQSYKKPPLLAIPTRVEEGPYKRCIYVNGRYRSVFSPGAVNYHRLARQMLAQVADGVCHQQAEAFGEQLAKAVMSVGSLTIEQIIQLSDALGFNVSFGATSRGSIEEEVFPL